MAATLSHNEDYTEGTAAAPFLPTAESSGGDDDFFGTAIAPVGVDDDEGMILDLSETPDKPVFEVWPAGTYAGYIDSGDYGKSKKGNNMITWKIKATNPENGKERLFYFWSVLTPEMLPRLKQLLVRVAPDLPLRNVNVKTLGAELRGRPCQIKVAIGFNEGERRNEVKEILPPSVTSSNFLDE